MEPPQRTLWHWFRPVGDDFQRRQIVTTVRFAQENKIHKGWRSRQQFHFVPFDCAQHGVRVAILHCHDASRIGELVKHRIEAADVVVKQEGDRASRMPGDLELAEHANDIVEGRLALPRRAGGK